MNDELDVIYARINQVMPTDRDKLNLIATLTGAGAELAIFLSKHRDFILIPPDISYMMCLIISSAKAFSCDHDCVIGKDMALIDIADNDKLIMVLKGLVEQYKEELGL